MPHKKGTELEQLLLMPPSLEDYIAMDNPVRVTKAFVDTLDIEKLKFQKARCKEMGCRPYHPGDLLKLYMYVYTNRIRTSRKLERECTRNIELMWLLRDLRPSARTIAYFRTANKRALKQVFRQFIIMTKQWGLIEGKLLATDGSKLRAVNSKKNNYNAKKIAFHFGRIDEKIQGYLDELDKQDKEENGNRKEDIEKTIRELKERRRKYEELEKEIIESGEEQISTTDEESRQLMIRGQITEVAYNVQTTLDSKHNLVIDVKAVNTNDKKLAPVMGRRAKAIIGNGDFDYLLDKGYHDGESIASCEDHVLMKGIDKVEAESNLTFLCYNLKRVINILGVNVLIKRLKEISLYFVKRGFKIFKMWISDFSNRENGIKKWIAMMNYNCFKTLNLSENF